MPPNQQCQSTHTHNRFTTLWIFSKHWRHFMRTMLNEIIFIVSNHTSWLWIRCKLCGCWHVGWTMPSDARTICSRHWSVTRETRRSLWTQCWDNCGSLSMHSSWNSLASYDSKQFNSRLDDELWMNRLSEQWKWSQDDQRDSRPVIPQPAEKLSPM